MSDAHTKTEVGRGANAARQAAQDATEAGKERLAEGSERAAEGVDDFADAVSSAASRLNQLEHQGLADYANQMASWLGDISGKLREENIDELAGDVRAVAERNPALFVLGSVAAGLALSRFAKATRSSRNLDETDQSARWGGYEDGVEMTDSALPRGPLNEQPTTPDATGGSGVEYLMDEQPLVVGAVGIAIGAALGAVLPRTESEDRLLGGTSDSVARTAKEKANETYSEVKETAADVAASASRSEARQREQKAQSAVPQQSDPQSAKTASANTQWTDTEWQDTQNH